MSLAPGTRFGPYEILSPLGAGGMGEVYRARDTRLDRTVAIKVLPSHLSASPEARQRFDREARAISSLNHPHICALYDVGHQEGMNFLVMEYLEGETLADRLQRGPLSLEQTLRTGIEIASALDRAHRQNLVHRDLKPANVMLVRSGAKLLDFGLAKLQGPDSPPPPGGLSTLATGARNLTAEGTLLGTFQYMAPEQLEGKEADARTDLFAFGAVVYEMATAKKAFEGKSQASLISAIMSSQPAPISSIQRMAPAALDRIVRTCLAKNPDDRWQSAHDLMLQLEWVVGGDPAAEAAGGAAAPRRGRERIWMTAAGILLVASLLLAGLLVSRSPGEAGMVRLSLTRPANAPYATFDRAVISPDGKRIVFEGRTRDGREQLWIRDLESSEARPLGGTEGASDPFWSPDSRHLGLFAAGKLKKIDVSGGPAQVLCDAPAGRTGAWSSGGIILFENGLDNTLHQVSASGGTSSRVTTLGPREEGHLSPSFLPDGRHFVFLGDAGTTEDHHLKLGSLDDKECTDLLGAISNVAFVSPGTLLYVRAGSLLAHPFDPARLQLAGDPMVIAKDLVLSDDPGHHFEFSVSSAGRLLYRSADPTSQLVWMDSTGRRLAGVGERGRIGSFALSPDQHRVSFEQIDEDGRVGETRLLDLARGTVSRLTFHAGSDYGVVWSPNGSEFVFTSARSGAPEVYRVPLTNPGQESLVFKWSEPIAHLGLTDWSPDGRRLLLLTNDSKTQDDIWVLSVEGSAKPEPLIRTPFNEGGAVFSPDGKWVAYQSDESGQVEVYVRDFAGGSQRYQVSTSGGTTPRWRGDGKEIFFRGPGRKLYSAEVRSAGAGLAIGAPVALFDLPGGGFFPSADGQRFLVDALTEDPGSAPYTVVLNWTRMLSRR